MAQTFTHVPSPVALTATGLDSAIELHWQYGKFGQYVNFDHFEIYRSTDGGRTFCFQASVTWDPPYDPKWVDEAPPGGWSVYFVRAVSKSGQPTGRSNTAAAYPKQGSTNVTACTAALDVEAW